MEPKIPRIAEVVPINAHVAKLREAAALRRAVVVAGPLDEGLARATHALHNASIFLLRGESPESVVHRFRMSTQDKGAFFDIRLFERDGELIRRGTKDIMLVGIDPPEKSVLVLDWYGTKVTLAEGGESVPIGSGRYRLYLDSISSEQVPYPCDREPIRKGEELRFLFSHLDAQWRAKYDELW